MAHPPKKPDVEIEKRRDDALRRALGMPHKPQEALKKGKPKPGGADAKREKRTAGNGRARVGKARKGSG